MTMASRLTFHVRLHVNVSCEDQAWNSGGRSKEFIKFLQNPVGLDTDSQDIINKISFPLYSVHNLAECQIPG